MWKHEKAHRESPRIFANRIFLAPSCSAPAYRLRRNRTPSGKMLGKNPRAGFSFKLVLFLCDPRNNKTIENSLVNQLFS